MSVGILRYLRAHTEHAEQAPLHTDVRASILLGGVRERDVGSSSPEQICTQP